MESALKKHGDGTERPSLNASAQHSIVNRIP